MRLQNVERCSHKISNYDCNFQQIAVIIRNLAATFKISNHVTADFKGGSQISNYDCNHVIATFEICSHLTATFYILQS